MAARRVTQADVARLAGVSQATVSTVLNQGASPVKGPRIGPETVQRVLDAIKMTGYVANPLAQGLARGRNQIVGVFTYESVFPSGAGDFYHPFLSGIEAAAERATVDVLLFTSAPIVDGRRSLLAGGWNRLGVTDGCLLLGRHSNKSELATLAAREYPFVFIGRREAASVRIPYVGADYATGTRDVLATLLSRGHRRIGFLEQLSDDESVQDRVDGYRAAMAEARLRPLLIDAVGSTPDGLVEMIIDNRLTAAVLGAQVDAPGIRVAAEQRGVAVPQQLSLAILGQPEHPDPGDRVRWTGFHTPREAMGSEAMVLLRELIEGLPRDDANLQRLLACVPVAGETIAAPHAGNDTSDGTAQ